MISLSNVSHELGRKDQRRWLLLNQELLIGDRERVGILIAKGGGKTTFAKLLCGAETPHFGSIHVRGAVSWPIGTAGVIHQNLSLHQNLSIIAQAATSDAEGAIEKFFSLMGTDLNMNKTAKDLAPSDRALFAYGLSIMIPRQHYIFDDKVTFGTTQQRMRQDELLSNRLRNSGLVLVSSNKRLLAQYCYKFFQLQKGRLIAKTYQDISKQELEDV